jgi:hypothetical protein
MDIRALALMTAATAALLAPASAEAITAGVQDGVLRVTGDPGEKSNLSMEGMQGNRIRFTQTFEANRGAGCTQTGELICDAGSGVLVSLADGDDELWVRPNLPAPFTYSGGTGRDTIRFSHTDGIPVWVDNDGKPDDGPLGRDDVEADVEIVHGSFANDMIGSGSRGASINPREGDDIVRGGRGPDRITAAYIELDGADTGLYTEGSDTVSCGGGQDFVLHSSSDTIADDCEAFGRNTPEDPAQYYLFQGSGGDDFLGAPQGWSPARMNAGAGDDVVQPPLDGSARIVLGSGNDRVRGTAGSYRVYGQSGNDVILVRDGSIAVDTIDCGSGRDRVEADLNDKVSRNCESVSRRRAAFEQNR